MGDRQAMEKSAGGRSTAHLRRLAVLTLALLLLLLLLQVLMGMIVNLFVTVPGAHPGTGTTIVRGALAGLGWAIGSGSRSLTLHVLVGLLLGVSTIVLLVASIASRRPGWWIVATIGLVATLYAGLNGIAFMDAGKRDEYSLEMSVGLIVAVAAYVAGLVLPERSP